MQVIGIAAAICFLAFGCQTKPRASEPTVEENEDVRIEEKRASAIWKKYLFKQPRDKTLTQLLVDGKITLRESDHNSDGVTDAVRVRLSDGRFVIIEDTDHDGEFDRVRKGP
jgi:hypothetical protein